MSHPSALWQLLTAANPDVKATAPARKGPKAASAAELTGARSLDIIDLVKRRKVMMHTLTPATVPFEPAFERRIRHFVSAVPAGPVQDRFVRWEIIKMGMCHGIIANGCITDTAEGRAILIPLKMAQIPTTPQSTQLRTEAINHPQVQSELFRLWNVISLRGGVTLASYYGLSKVLYRCLLPHLSEREIHQLISTEVEIDLPDQADDDALMTMPQFLRWIASLTLIWLESHCVVDALTFVELVAALFQMPIESIDMDFAERYGRKDPSLLIPIIPAKVSAGGADALVAYAKEQLILTIRVRFGSLLSDAPITSKARVKKRQRNTAGRSIGNYMAPAMESSARVDDEEAVMDGVTDDPLPPFGGVGGIATPKGALMSQSRLSVSRRRSPARSPGEASVGMLSTTVMPLELSMTPTSLSMQEDSQRRGTPAVAGNMDDSQLLIGPSRVTAEVEMMDRRSGSYYSNRFGISSRCQRDRQAQRDARAGAKAAGTPEPVRPPMPNTYVANITKSCSASPVPRAAPRHLQPLSTVASTPALPLRVLNHKAPDASAAKLLSSLKSAVAAAAAIDLRHSSEFGEGPHVRLRGARL